MLEKKSKGMCMTSRSYTGQESGPKEHPPVNKVPVSGGTCAWPCDGKGDLVVLGQSSAELEEMQMPASGTAL